MDELKQKYATKTEEMKEKYADVINDIAVAQGVDVGVAFEMLKAVARGGDYLGDTKVDLEELKADYLELRLLSMKIAK